MCQFNPFDPFGIQVGNPFWHIPFTLQENYCGNCGNRIPAGHYHSCPVLPTPPPVAPQGWECPRCHAVNAPSVTQCGCAAG